MKNYLLFVLLCCAVLTSGQTTDQKPGLALGTELDILPYITGGYYGSVWASNNHFRYRAVITQVTTPDFMLEASFTNNEMMVYAALIDYFFAPRPEKWWIGSGFEYWDAEIQTTELNTTEAYSNTMWTLGGGYVWKFYKNFYLNPWAAVHLRIAGDQSVIVDGQEFEPAWFVPEASLKVGWYFNTKN